MQYYANSSSYWWCNLWWEIHYETSSFFLSGRIGLLKLRESPRISDNIWASCFQSIIFSHSCRREAAMINLFLRMGSESSDVWNMDTLILVKTGNELVIFFYMQPTIYGTPEVGMEEKIMEPNSKPPCLFYCNWDGRFLSNMDSMTFIIEFNQVGDYRKTCANLIQSACSTCFELARLPKESRNLWIFNTLRPYWVLRCQRHSGSDSVWCWETYFTSKGSANTQHCTTSCHQNKSRLQDSHIQIWAFFLAITHQ